MAPVLSGLALRLVGITRSSIWHDEGYTMWLLTNNFIDIVKRDMRDVHPPGYYLMAKIWVSVFGDSVFAIRFFSLIFSVAIIYLVFSIVKRVFNEKAAFWSALFVAFSPFMIRFGQEARMYGVVAFFTTLATYFLVRFIQEKKNHLLIWYALAMILAIYNQYYAFFVVISHWLILSIATPGFWKLKWQEAFKSKLALFNPWWWVANVSIVLAYAPWFYIAFKQVTRISGSYWILPEWITLKTIPSSVMQFIAYTHLDGLYQGILGKGLYWLLALVLIFLGAWLWKIKENRGALIAIYIFGFLPMILVFVVSKLRAPIYMDRYFPFSAIGVFVLWGAAVAFIKSKNLRIISGILLLALMCFGYFMMRHDVNHQMRQLSETVETQAREGDMLLSGELYTYLDGAYYLGYDRLKFLSRPVDGYGETSLFYDKQANYLVDPSEKNTLPDRVWLIGKSGKDYFEPQNWVGWDVITYFESGGLKASLYTR